MTVCALSHTSRSMMPGFARLGGAIRNPGPCAPNLMIAYHTADRCVMCATAQTHTRFHFRLQLPIMNGSRSCPTDRTVRLVLTEFTKQSLNNFSKE